MSDEPDTKLVQRRPNGTFAPGNSGNPKRVWGAPDGNKPGRKKGRTLGDACRQYLKDNPGCEDEVAEALWNLARDTKAMGMIPAIDRLDKFLDGLWHKRTLIQEGDEPHTIEVIEHVEPPALTEGEGDGE